MTVVVGSAVFVGYQPIAEVQLLIFSKSKLTKRKILKQISISDENKELGGQIQNALLIQVLLTTNDPKEPKIPLLGITKQI